MRAFRILERILRSNFGDGVLSVVLVATDERRIGTAERKMPHCVQYHSNNVIKQGENNCGCRSIIAAISSSE